MPELVWLSQCCITHDAGSFSLVVLVWLSLCCITHDASSFSLVVIVAEDAQIVGGLM